MSDAAWRVIDTAGATHWPPRPIAQGDGHFSCADGRDGSNFATPLRAVLWWVLFRSTIDAAEVVAPGTLSAAERDAVTTQVRAATPGEGRRMLTWE